MKIRRRRPQSRVAPLLSDPMQAPTTEQHPDGYVLVRKGAEWPKLVLAGRARKWVVFDADGVR